MEFRHALSGFFLDLGVYALAFFIIGQYWQSHHRVMHYVEAIDRRVIRRTIALLAGVAALPVAAGWSGRARKTRPSHSTPPVRRGP